MTDAVYISDLEKDFGAFRAVNKLTLRVKRGEIYGLLGPNGAGKTTVIKILCGLLRPTSGEVYVLDKKIPDPNIASLIGYMPQELALYRGLTVHENLAFYGEVFSLTKAQINAREQALLRLVGLEAYNNTLIDRLSGGMQQRISLACALLHEPQTPTSR